MKLYTTKIMAKKKTSNKELKVKEVSKEEISKPFPTTYKVKIYLFKTGKEHVCTNEIAKIIVENNRGKLV